MKLIGKGAEAEVYLEENKIIKKRIPKKYRLREIDDSLRKTRTRREAKIIETLPAEVLHPALLKTDEKKAEIEMSFIDGKKIRDILDNNLRNRRKDCINA